MRYPHDNFTTDWNVTAGYGYGDATAYGFHEGVDVNDNGGGNSDLGKPIVAIADGVVTSVHDHTGVPTFGKHIHYQIDGPWGTRYVHHAHCQAILVQVGDKIQEGQVIARVGNSGTVFAHDHWAIKKRPTGVDAICTLRVELEKWEDPMAFVKQWLVATPPPPPAAPFDPNRLNDDEVELVRIIQKYRGGNPEGGQESTLPAFGARLIQHDSGYYALGQTIQDMVNETQPKPTVVEPTFTNPIATALYELAKKLG